MLSVLLGSWFALAVFALLTLCAYSVSMKWLLTAEDELDPLLLTALVCALIGASAAALRLGAGELLADLSRLTSGRGVALAALDVALYTAAPALYYRAMKVLPVSQVTVLQSFVGVFALLFGVALGAEVASILHAFGAALIIAAVALVPRGSRGRGPSRATLGLLVATMLYGGAAIVDKTLVSSVGLPADLVLCLAFLPPGLLLGALALGRSATPRADLRRAFRVRRVYVNAAIMALSYGAVYRAYGLGGSASAVSLILAAEAVLVVLFSALVLRERDRLAAKLLASVLALAGVYLVRAHH